MAGCLADDRRNVQDSINTQPWYQLTTQKETGTEYLVKYHFDKIRCTYDVMVYDGVILRHQQLVGDDEFEIKSKVFNPNIEASASSLMEELLKSFEECLKNSSIVLQKNTRNNTILEMHIKSKLKAGIPFNWTFSLEESPKESLWLHVVRPLTTISNELFRRQQELCHMLERKDKEIQDYKDQGTTVSRNHLETPYFDRVEYQRTAYANQAFLNSCTQPTLTPLSGNLSDIYRKTMLNMESQKTPTEVARPEPGPSATFDTVPITGRIAPSWENDKRIGGGSFVQDQIDGGNDGGGVGGEVGGQEVRNDTLPMVVTNAKSPEEEEKNRREALRKRLDDETDKKSKKKKRKLKI